MHMHMHELRTSERCETISSILDPDHGRRWKLDLVFLPIDNVINPIGADPKLKMGVVQLDDEGPVHLLAHSNSSYIGTRRHLCGVERSESCARQQVGPPTTPPETEQTPPGLLAVVSR